MGEFNRSGLDEVGSVGGQEEGMNVISEMNSLVDDHDGFVKCLATRSDG